MTQQDKERIEKDASNALRCLYLEVPESIAQDVDNKVSAYVHLLQEQLKQERNKAIDEAIGEVWKLADTQERFKIACHNVTQILESLKTAHGEH